MCFAIFLLSRIVPADDNGDNNVVPVKLEGRQLGIEQYKYLMETVE